MVGEEPVDAELRLVKPNDWNPNEMTEDEYEGTKHGLKTRGWYRSQAMLIWGTDEKGRVQNVIIDGEHRWKGAIEIGMKTAPMVFIHGLTRDQAKGLTIEIDRKRGKFNQEKLGHLVREIQHQFPPETMARDLGFNPEEMMKLLAEPAVNLNTGDEREPDGEGGGVGGTVVSGNPHVKQVPLFFDPKEYDAFQAAVQKLSKRWQQDNITQVVARAVKEAC